MKPIEDSTDAKWLTLELKIGKWADNRTEPEHWEKVNEIARCDLSANVCTTTDNYFTTMSFDFKSKLDSAFGTIGHNAYFIQGIYMIDWKPVSIFAAFQVTKCSRLSIKPNVSPTSICTMK